MDVSMFAVLLHLLFLVSRCSQYQIQQQTSLNAAVPVNKGATVSFNPASTSISTSDPFTYRVNIHAQSLGYDLKLSLNDSWSFPSNMSSILSFTVDGSTPNTHNDTDLFLVFAVADEQYLSFYTHLDDTSNIQSRIYFQFANAVDAADNVTGTTVPVSEWLAGDNRMMDRWDRLSNGDEWIVLEQDSGAAAMWPLRFEVLNDPVSDRAWFKFYDNAAISSRVEYMFESAFATRELVDVYLLADAAAQSFDVSGFEVALFSVVDDVDVDVVHELHTYRVLIQLKFDAATNADAMRQLPWEVHERLTAYILSSVSCAEYDLAFESVKTGSSDVYPLMMNIDGNLVFCHAIDNVSDTQTSMAEYLQQNNVFFNITLSEVSITLLATNDDGDVILVNDTVVPSHTQDEDADGGDAHLTTTSGRSNNNQWPLDPTTQQNTKNNKFDTELLLWLMKLIAAQLILCCVLVMIILLLKYATFKLRAKREEMRHEKSYAVKMNSKTVSTATSIRISLDSKPNTSIPATFDSQMGVPASEALTEKFRGESETAHQPMYTISRKNAPKSRLSTAASIISKISKSRSVKSKTSNASKTSKASSKASKVSSKASKVSKSKSKNSKSQSRGTKISKSKSKAKSKKNSKISSEHRDENQSSAQSKHSRINTMDTDEDENEQDVGYGDEQRMLQQQQDDESDYNHEQLPPVSSMMTNFALQRAPSSKSINSAVSAQLKPVMDGGGSHNNNHGRNFSTLSQEICDDIYDEPSQRHSDDNLLADIDESMELEADDESLPQRMHIIGQTTSIPPEVVNGDEQMSGRVVRGNTIYSDHSRYPSIPDGSVFITGNANNGNGNHGNGNGAASELKKLFAPNSAVRKKSNHHVSPTLTFSLPKYLRRNGVV